MSSNSVERICATAPIVSAFRGRESPRLLVSASCLAAIPIPVLLTLQVTELVLADLNLVTVGELVRLDSTAIDIGAVQRAQVVDVVAVLPVHDQRVVARHGHVVEKDRCVGGAPDADPLVLHGEALARTSAAGAND